MEVGWSDDVLYSVAEKLRERGDTQGAHQVAKRMLDRDMARAAEASSVSAPRKRTTDACQLALEDAKHGRYTDAYKKIEGNKCNCMTAAAIYAEARDAVNAERAMRTCTDPNQSDISAAMAGLAKRFAANGDIVAALKFVDAAHIPGAYEDGEGYVGPALRDIARAWSRKDGATSVLKWARSRSTGYERGMALLGVGKGTPGTTYRSAAKPPA